MHDARLAGAHAAHATWQHDACHARPAPSELQALSGPPRDVAQPPAACSSSSSGSVYMAADQDKSTLRYAAYYAICVFFRHPITTSERELAFDDC